MPDLPLPMPDLHLPHDYAKALAEAGLDATPTGDVTCPDPGALLAAQLPVFALAAGAVAAFTQAANRVRAAAGVRPRPVRLDPERIAASFSGDRMLRLSGTPIDGFADLSGFFRARDGWVRTHANYPHHRARLLRALDVPADAGEIIFGLLLAGEGQVWARNLQFQVVGPEVVPTRATIQLNLESARQHWAQARASMAKMPIPPVPLANPGLD